MRRKSRSIRLPSDGDDPVEYLVRRKFPALRAYKAPVVFGVEEQGPSYQQRQAYIAKANKYAEELSQLPDAELSARFESEKAKERQEAEAKRDAEEQARFFNAPYAKADFTHWARATYWTIEEAVALSFGKSPAVVNWDSLKQYARVSPFVAEYAKVRDLAIRAKNWKQLYDPVVPGIFFAWAKRCEISYPDELAVLAERYGHNIRDWQTAYEELMALHERQKRDLETELGKTKQAAASALETVERLRAEAVQLATERNELLAQIATLEAGAKGLNPKERDSLLKMVIGMAVDAYGYDPTARRSPISSELTDILAGHGLAISEDTVRKWLNEAAQVLPKNSGDH